MTSRKRWAETRFRALCTVAVMASISFSAPVAASAQDGESLIRDTEIEEILSRTPCRSDEGGRPRSEQSVHILLVGSKDLQAFAGSGHHGHLYRPHPRIEEPQSS
jgi:predicted Zn-dependent protease